MKKYLSFVLFITFLGCNVAFAVNSAAPRAFLPKADLSTDTKMLMDKLEVNNVEDFLNLTPKKFKQQTGKRLGIKNAIKLKAAQKIIKKRVNGEPDIPKGLYVVGAILGFAWILMGVMDDWEGKNWWVSLLLFVLCWLPGVIHAFVKQKEYYS